MTRNFTILLPRSEMATRAAVFRHFLGFGLFSAEERKENKNAAIEDALGREWECTPVRLSLVVK